MLLSVREEVLIMVCDVGLAKLWEEDEFEPPERRDLRLELLELDVSFEEC